MNLSHENLEARISVAARNKTISNIALYTCAGSSWILFAYTIFSTLYEKPFNVPAVIALNGLLLGGSVLGVYTYSRAQNALEQALSLRQKQNRA